MTWRQPGQCSKVALDGTKLITPQLGRQSQPGVAHNGVLQERAVPLTDSRRSEIWVHDGGVQHDRQVSRRSCRPSSRGRA